VTRALVLGGGGPLGVGWLAGLLTAVLDGGVAVDDADFVVGTSAGSIVGAQLTTGRPLADLPAQFGGTAPWRTAGDDTSLDLAELIATVDPAEATPEADWVTYFDSFRDADWPEQFRCTAFNLESGAFAVWDASSGVNLARAVASSCTVPGLVMPVTIHGEAWIDGGARDALNADLALGHDVVIAVSCMTLDPSAHAVPELLAGLVPGTQQRIDELRAGDGAVAIVEPAVEFGELSGWGRNLMDTNRIADAFAAGMRQGRDELARLRAIWG
jgi:NTE family protein